jgi:mRNA-degrading endonuclease toxin of MazEF toxin-antitoxin module
MPINRGDLVLAYVPNVGRPGGKLRPALVVQSDHNNVRLNETIIAAITSNTSRVHESTQLLVEVATPDGYGVGTAARLGRAVRAATFDPASRHAARHW